MYANILIEYPVKSLDKSFTYLIPDKYKNEIKNKLPNMDISYKALYYACLLPNNQFYGIIKYTWS